MEECPMIWVTRLNGTEMVVNADLIETVESTPDTVLTLVDGKKYVVHESSPEIVERVQAYRASILALLEAANPFGHGDGTPAQADPPPVPARSRAAETNLYVVPAGDEEA